MKVLCYDPVLWDGPSYVNWLPLRQQLVETSNLPFGEAFTLLDRLFRDYLIADSVHTSYYYPDEKSPFLTRDDESDQPSPGWKVLCPVQGSLPFKDNHYHKTYPSKLFGFQERLETIQEEDKEEEDGDDEDVKRPSFSAQESRVKKDESRSWWRPTPVLKTLLLLAFLVMAVFCVSYICSNTSVTYQTDGVGLTLEIHVLLPHPSGFTFGFDKLMSGSRLLISPSLHMLTKRSRLPNCSIHMSGCSTCYHSCLPT